MSSNERMCAVPALPAVTARWVGTAALLMTMGALALPPAAAADDRASMQARAAAAYDMGLDALRDGDHQRAGEAFVRANAHAPSPIALAQAVRAFRAANQLRLAGSVALKLLAQDGLPSELREIAEASVADARQWYARIDVDCAAPCDITVDGEREDGLRFFAAPDRELRIVATFRDGATEEQTVTASAGDARLVAFVGPRSEVSTSVRSEDSFEHSYDEANPYHVARDRYFSRPRGAFFAFLATSLFQSGVVAWSALDTRNSRLVLREAQRVGEPLEVERARWERDRNARRSRWLAVQTGTFFLATAVIASLTDWSAHRDRPLSGMNAALTLSPEGAVATVVREF